MTEDEEAAESFVAGVISRNKLQKGLRLTPGEFFRIEAEMDKHPFDSWREVDKGRLEFHRSNYGFDETEDGKAIEARHLEDKKLKLSFGGREKKETNSFSLPPPPKPMTANELMAEVLKLVERYKASLSGCEKADPA